ncbi:hypothetical protein OMAG_001708 [Candidatus Omnitrophus magneticus]|uniref:Uncharacterized protein n=1 Tax=Candidatus Omnitrophus magneticus TaxID=1609969 RepID=A0A0F0CQX7_9BACT|nr:hypothetical protein OMAG_001708 [Candidatus Omnitrophus magneticus]
MANLHEELKNLGALDIIIEIETDVGYRGRKCMFQQHSEFCHIGNPPCFMGVLACFHFTHFNIFGVIPFIFLDVYRTGL